MIIIYISIIIIFLFKNIFNYYIIIIEEFIFYIQMQQEVYVSVDIHIDVLIDAEKEMVTIDVR